MTETRTVPVPGARLHVAVRGRGPHLLIVPGGDGDADTLDGMVEHLVAEFTVITYDRRGLSRSLVDGPPARVAVTTHADDAHRLLADVTDEPAYVFGTSMGALIGLELVAEHPEQARTLLAHEPPLTQVLPPEQRRVAVAALEEIEKTYLHEGTTAAMRRLTDTTGIVLTDREPGATLPRPTAQRRKNLDYLLGYDTIGAREFRLDIDAVRGKPVEIGAGEMSSGGFPYQCAQALALLIERPLISFPGGHTGYGTHPRAFASTLLKIFRR